MNWDLVLSLLSRFYSPLKFSEYQAWLPQLNLLPCQPQELERFLSWHQGLAAYFSQNPLWFLHLEQQYDLLLKSNIEPLYPTHPLYPQKFFELTQPPLFLSMFGNLAAVDPGFVLSVVGSREPQQKSLQWLEQNLYSAIGEAPCCIVSGAARGIDQKAHGIALLHKLPTIAFLPSGLLNIYPYFFQSWVVRIVEQGGAVVSEYLPNERMQKGHFVRRNRLIAALADLLLVAEARRASGSMLTVQHAMALGRPIAVVPGHPLEIAWSGSNDLVFDGAQMLRDHHDLRGLLLLKNHKNAYEQLSLQV